MHESDSSPSNSASASESDRIELRDRLLGLLLLAVVGLVAYSGLIIGIVRVWAWIGAHFSSVELQGSVTYATPEAPATLGGERENEVKHC